MGGTSTKWTAPVTACAFRGRVRPCESSGAPACPRSQRIEGEPAGCNPDGRCTAKQPAAGCGSPPAPRGEVSWLSKDRVSKKFLLFFIRLVDADLFFDFF